QVSVYRRADGGLTTRGTRRGAGAFTMLARERPKGGRFDAGPPPPVGPRADPTPHYTISPNSRPAPPRPAVSSDPPCAELDRLLPRERWRVVLSVQRSVDAPDGKLAGVARVAMVSSELDAIAARRFGDPQDPTRILLLAASPGPPTAVHLVARIDPSDR